MNKKSLLALLISAFIFPAIVNAADPEVSTLEPSVSDKVISYSGTVKNGSHAVMCKLLNSKSEEIDMLSSEVDSNKFSGSFEVTEAGKYSVSCANYEGGKFVTKEVEVSEDTDINVVAGNESAEDAKLDDLVKKAINKIIAGEEVKGFSDELKEKIINAVNENKEITVNLNINDVDEEDVEEDADLINEKIGNDYKVAGYFNINISIVIDGEVAGNVTVLSSDIDLNLEFPDDLDDVAEGYTRIFKVARVHGDEVVILDATSDEDGASTKSGLFSTYALIYQDVKNDVSPKTGDNIVISIVVLVAACLGLLGTVLYLRKKSN